MNVGGIVVAKALTEAGDFILDSAVGVGKKIVKDTITAIQGQISDFVQNIVFDAVNKQISSLIEERTFREEGILPTSDGPDDGNQPITDEHEMSYEQDGVTYRDFVETFGETEVLEAAAYLDCTTSELYKVWVLSGLQSDMRNVIDFAEQSGYTFASQVREDLVEQLVEDNVIDEEELAQITGNAPPASSKKSQTVYTNMTTPLGRPFLYNPNGRWAKPRRYRTERYSVEEQRRESKRANKRGRRRT